jgi:superfamily I DNA/RNA helicase
MAHDIHKRAKIIGSPGCGKTTYLLNLITQAASKYDPERIGAVSLTNAAIEEMKDRVKKETGLSKESAKNIRTIHSTCFRLLELKKEQVADKKIKEFNEAYPKWEMPLDIEITEDEHFIEKTGQFTARQNKIRFNEIQMLRHQLVPVEQWPDLLLREMYKDWCNWMAKNNYNDFTGMLEDILLGELCPDIDILLVDEAQDMSRLSMHLLEMWGKNTVSTVYVGDSDQAILRFAGAVPEAFINLNHTWMKVLGKSYRVPKKVYEYAMEVISQAKNREDVIYEPTEVEGNVIRCSEPDLSLEGTHMILGRCNFHLNRWKHYLLKHGQVWHNPYRPGDLNYNPMNTKLWRAARNYVKICRGEEIENKDLRHMVKNMIAEGNIVRGMKSKVEDITFDEKVDMFGLISSGVFTKEFLKLEKTIEEVFMLKGQSGDMLRKCEDIMAKPKIILGTYHSVKGGESDHVWLDTGTSAACLRGCAESVENFYDEVRVAFVGGTRSRKNVGLLLNSGLKGRVWG